MRTTTARARGTGGWHGAVLTCTLPTSKHAALATSVATALGAATEYTALAAVFVATAVAAASVASSLRAARGACAWAWRAVRVCTVCVP